jgi:hypothetical protein
MMANHVVCGNGLRITILGVVLLALAAGCASRPVTSVSASSPVPTNSTLVTAPSGVDQTLLHECEAARQNCLKTVPGLAACVAAKRVCDERAYRLFLAARAKAAQAARSTSGIAATGSMSESEALTRALTVSPDATAASPSVAKEMTLSEYNAMSGDPLSEPGESSDSTEVWVVTVRAPMYTDGAPGNPPLLKQSYTVVFDATTGSGLETCIGCATLSG